MILKILIKMATIWRKRGAFSNSVIFNLMLQFFVILAVLVIG